MIEDAHIATVTDPAELQAIRETMAGLAQVLERRERHRAEHPVRAFLERIGFVGPPVTSDKPSAGHQE